MENVSKDVRTAVRQAVNSVAICDVHTHIYNPGFGELLLWGFDEAVTYHYLIAELFRSRPDLDYAAYGSMSKSEQADLIWRTLFVENSPISEAARGIVTILAKLGIDISDRDTTRIRQYFQSKSVEEYVDIVFELSNVSKVIMTNDPFDDAERPVWENGVARDSRFVPALRIDGLLNDWASAGRRLREWGFPVAPELSDQTLEGVRQFLRHWADVMKPVYMAASLPPTFAYPEDSPRGLLMERAVLPVARELGLPVALMIGVRKLANPELKLAGDAVSKSSVEVVESLAARNPDVQFLITMLSRENQHELCVAGRKFKNIVIFGCWWFLNNPSIIREMTAERIELLGPTFIPQHSDARILDQLIYKWAHSREVIGDVLAEKYADLAAAGWVATPQEIERDVNRMFSGQLITSPNL